jgi:hypothetical protein
MWPHHAGQPHEPVMSALAQLAARAHSDHRRGLAVVAAHGLHRTNHVHAIHHLPQTEPQPQC